MPGSVIISDFVKDFTFIYTGPAQLTAESPQVQGLLRQFTALSGKAPVQSIIYEERGRGNRAELTVETTTDREAVYSFFQLNKGGKVRYTFKLGGKDRGQGNDSRAGDEWTDEELRAVELVRESVMEVAAEPTINASRVEWLKKP